jgi:uncharacterized membrane protein
MERMLVVVFDSEAKAYEGSRALQALDEESIIAVYADGVVAKDPDGTTTVIKSHDGGPQATMGGTAVGTLLGLLGGPVGLAVGAVSGFVVGAATDVARSRVGRDFVTNVVNALTPGKAAVVAEIDEESTGPVDARMEALGGYVFRRALSDVADSEDEQEIDAIKADIAQTKAEHAGSRAERQARLQARIDSLNETLHQRLDRARASREAIQREAEAKVEHLKAQAVSARDDMKARQAERITAVRRRYNEWLDRLASHVS